MKRLLHFYYKFDLAKCTHNLWNYLGTTWLNSYTLVWRNVLWSGNNDCNINFAIDD